MADNTVLNAGTGGDTLRDKDRAGVKTPIVALDLNPAGSETLMAGAMPVTGTFWQATQPVSGTLTANAGTNLNTSLLAVESGGHLANLDTKTPALGQALAAASVPVVLTSAQLGTLTPLSTVAVSTISGALPAGTNLIGQTAASHETGTIYSGTTAITPKFAVISASASGPTTVVAAVGGKRIRVLRWSLSANGVVNVKWQSHVTPTDLTGLHYLASYSGAGGAYCPVGIFQTAVGEALDINLSAAIAVGGELTYIEV